MHVVSTLLAQNSPLFSPSHNKCQKPLAGGKAAVKVDVKAAGNCQIMLGISYSF